MNCDEAIDRVLKGGASLSEVSQHLSSCPACSSIADLTSDLSERGRALRCDRLNPDAAARLRREVQCVVEFRPRARQMSSRDFVRPGRRLALATCALVLLAGAALMLMPGDPNRQLTDPQAVPSVTAVRFHYDEEIDRLSRRLGSRVRRFESRHLGDTRPNDFRQRAAALKHRIDFGATRVRREM